MNIELTIVICTYNRDKYIYQTLQKIALNTFSANKYEIILVNNNSTDRTETECKRFQSDFPELNFRYFIEKQQGLSFARNRGIEESKGDTIIFIDDDAFMETNYLHNLSVNLKSYPEVSAFGGKIIPCFENGKTPEWLSRWTYIWVSAIDKGQRISKFKGKSYPIGANMGFRRICFQYGKFNTSLGRNKDNLMGGEEKDIFKRLKKHNLNIYYFPDIQVTHMIPEKRTTNEFIQKLALGVGKSEKIRALGISRLYYWKCVLNEGIKWAATLILCAAYILSAKPKKGFILIYFRRYVSQGLLTH